MRLLRVIWLVVGATAKNRARTMLKRLRRPTYLIATLAGVAYLWLALSPFLRGNTRRDVQALGIVIAGLPLLAFVFVLLVWLLGAGSRQAALPFSEAEIQFLFPGPLTRRSLLLYRMGLGVARALQSSLVVTVLFWSKVPSPPLFLLGIWLALSILMFHQIGATLTRAMLFTRGRAGAAILWLAIAGMAIAMGVLAFRSWRELGIGDIERWRFRELATLAERAWSTSIGHALVVFHAPLRAALARDLPSFLAALPLPLAMLVGHVLWVVYVPVRFEEPSLDLAQRRAHVIDQGRMGRRNQLVTKRPKTSTALSPIGAPQWALAWKNILAARRIHMMKLATLTALPAFIAIVGCISSDTFQGRLTAIAIGAIMLPAMLVVLGPRALAADFRMEQGNMDILRSLPLSGRQVVWGELLGPLSLLIGLQWVALAIALFVALSVGGLGIGTLACISIALSMAVLSPVLTALFLVIENAAVLLFPAWTSTGQLMGVEAIGQRMLTWVVSMLALVVAILPAFAVGIVVLFGSLVAFGVLGAPIAAIAASGLIAVEIVIAIRWLGRVFERLDVTSD